MELSAGVLLYRRDSRGRLKVVLVKAARASFNNWGIPKGRVEEGEDILHAALRECQEETGITPGCLHVFSLGETVYPSKRKRIHGYAAHTVCEPQVTRPEEIEAARWFSLERAKAIIHPPQAVFLERLVDRLENSRASGANPSVTVPEPEKVPAPPVGGNGSGSDAADVKGPE